MPPKVPVPAAPEPADIPSPTRTSSQQLADTASTVPAAYRTSLTLTKDDLTEMKGQLTEWLANPQAMLQWMQTNTMLHLLLLNKIALTPVPGRSGPQAQLRAMREFSKAAAEILETARKQGLLPKDAAA